MEALFVQVENTILGVRLKYSLTSKTKIQKIIFIT